ncbi:MAG TPA: carboxypeptidase-like regulatory domain-containing protein [Candidatus Thermoplasmatota archaeon]|nr:carboxypeptidase-like regulatory domain-containing protein [Candidatus Thermoplasmatota archaeon]
MRIRFAVLAVAFSLLAGCADPGAPSDDAPAGPASPTSMAIVGLVQDEAFNAVGGAQVSLRLVNHTTVTDAAGAFRFQGLTVSAYLVDVNATGFEPATLTAEPSADGNSSLNFVLLQSTSLRPRTELSHFKGIFKCAMEALIIPGSCDTASTTFGGPGVFNDTSVFQVGLGRHWQSIIVDVDFDPANSPGLEGLRLVMRGVNDADKLNEYEQYGRFSGTGSFTARMDVNGTYEDGTAQVPGNLTLAELVMYPQGHGWHEVCDPRPEGDCFLGLGAGTDVQFDLYVTVFYNQRAPDGYTLLVD